MSAAIKFSEFSSPLPLDGISEDYIDCTESVGLRFHILECGYDISKPKPLVLLLHGFPELAYSWRKVMPAIASAGFHCVAVDQRGYGRTTGWKKASYDETNIYEYAVISYVQDVIALVFALGYNNVRCLVGHDVGAAVAAMCVLARPDLFTSCVLMSHPFKAAPELTRVRTHSGTNVLPQPVIERDPDIQTSLANLTPPRKPYKWYNATSRAAEDWDNAAQGLSSFLRGYFHLKSATNRANNPFPLKSWTASELAKMPGYYVMPLELSMPETVAKDMIGEDENATKSWLPDQDLAVYEDEWSRTGFQAALNFYRVATDKGINQDMLLSYAGAKISIPCAFVSGDKDWGNFQEPGALQAMERTCSDFRGIKIVKGAGHWPQQEQPGQVVAEILSFIWSLANPRLRGFAHQQPPAKPAGSTNTNRQDSGKSVAVDTSLGAANPEPVHAYGMHNSTDDDFLDTPVPGAPGPREMHGTTPSSGARADTPVVGSRSPWSAAPREQPRPPTGSKSQGQATEESNTVDDEKFREMMERSKKDLNRSRTPFEMNTELSTE